MIEAEHSHFRRPSLLTTTICVWLRLQASTALVCPTVAGQPSVETDDSGPRKTTVAVLWFENRTADPNAAHWQYGIPRLLKKELGQIESLRLRSANALSYAFEQLHVDPGAKIDVAAALAMGEHIEAQRVIYGSYSRESRQWHVRAEVLNVATGQRSNELDAVSADWYELRDRLVEQLVAKLGITLSEVERQHMKVRETTSGTALEWLCRAWTLQQENAPLPGQERCVRQALAADPQFATAQAALAATLAGQGRFEEAETAAQRGWSWTRTPPMHPWFLRIWPSNKSGWTTRSVPWLRPIASIRTTQPPSSGWVKFPGRGATTMAPSVTSMRQGGWIPMTQDSTPISACSMSSSGTACAPWKRCGRRSGSIRKGMMSMRCRWRVRPTGCSAICPRPSKVTTGFSSRHGKKASTPKGSSGLSRRWTDCAGL